MASPRAREEKLVTHAQIFWADTAVTALVGRAPEGPLDEVHRVTSAVQVAAAYGDPADSPLSRAAEDFFANDGRVALTVRAEDGEAGLAALQASDPFQLLVVDPDLAPGAVLAGAHALCERRHALLVADAGERGAMPQGLDRNAAVYYPRITDGSGLPRPCAPRGRRRDGAHRRSARGVEGPGSARPRSWSVRRASTRS